MSPWGKLEVRLAGMKSSMAGGKLQEQNGYNSLILDARCFGWISDDGMSAAEAAAAEAQVRNSTKVQTMPGIPPSLLDDTSP